MGINVATRNWASTRRGIVSAAPETDGDSQDQQDDRAANAMPAARRMSDSVSS